MSSISRSYPGESFGWSVTDTRVRFSFGLSRNTYLLGFASYSIFMNDHLHKIASISSLKYQKKFSVSLSRLFSSADQRHCIAQRAAALKEKELLSIVLSLLKISLSRISLSRIIFS